MTDNEKIDPPILSKYRVLKKLGSGAYGHVWKVSPTDNSGDVLALKKVFQAFQHDTDAQRTYREISILKKVDHSNIIKIHEVLPSISGRDIYLVFEYMSTDLYRTIYQNHLQDVHKKYIIYQLFKGLHYLHSAQILHRDLKPSNLLLSQQCHLKICDFGLARHLNSETKDENVLTQGVATRWYRAPEVLLGSNKYDQKADMWSAGCILAEMVLKNPLFNCNSTVAQFEKILQVVGRPSQDQLQKVGEIACCLIKQCSGVRQKSVKQVFGSAVDDKCLDLIYKLLRFDPSKRPSAREAMMHPFLKQFFKEEDLVQFKGTIVMQTDENVKLTTDIYRDLITKNFIEKQIPKHSRESTPQRFSDLKRERQKSFGKILHDIHSRKSSLEKESKESVDKSQRKNNCLFEQIIKERNSSVKNTRVKSSSGSHYSDKNKQNMNSNTGNPLEKFSQAGQKQPGTFAALRKVTGTRFNR